MSPLRRALDRVRSGGSGGFTLVELLVASTIFMLMGTVLFTTVIAGAKQARNGREYNDLNEEARLLLNRMSRELREAQAISQVVNPGAAATSTGAAMYGYYTASTSVDPSITFDVDFNGVGGIEPAAPDPERLTYVYDRVNKRVLLQAAGQSLPVLAGNVEAFSFHYTSRYYQSDGSIDGTRDGLVQWEELDADPIYAKGNGNHVLDGNELTRIDSITIDVTVLKGTRQQTYRTQVDLRNRPY